VHIIEEEEDAIQCDGATFAERPLAAEVPKSAFDP
jgi:hypothetical protein